MQFQDLYNSLFAILRFEGNNGKVVGTGFVIKTNPLYVLTCHHVVSEATEENNGNIKYSITKRSGNLAEFDLRQGEISFLRARRITKRPECDLALLEIDPNENADVAGRLNIPNATPLELSFSEQEREIGSDVEWLSTAALADITLTPRFFKGSIVSKYVANHQYSFVNQQSQTVNETMAGIRLLEVDKLFVPGSSGSPILNAATNRVIGYVHGFRSWPIITNTEMKQVVEITENALGRSVELREKVPLVASLSLGIDVRAVENHLRKGNFL